MIERTKLIGGLFQILCIIACALIIAMLAVILGNIVIHGVGSVTLDFLTKAPESGMTGGGIFPAIFGTVFLVILMTIAVIPLGVATAIYMHEYAPRRSRIVHLVRLAIQNLAGVPAIVFGLFGLALFVVYFGFGVSIPNGNLFRRQIVKLVYELFCAR